MKLRIGDVLAGAFVLLIMPVGLAVIVVYETWVTIKKGRRL